MNVSFAKPEERAEVLEWVRAQEGHEDYSFLNWSDVMVVRDEAGAIRAASEMATIQTAEFVFDTHRKARDTYRAWQAAQGFYAAHSIAPVFIMSSSSKLAPFVRRVLRRAFAGFEFFRR
jgi:hypothetical protein